ncbi:hypothetical protein HWV23_02705 [Natronomonas halophila]|uniref:hypothetical protein n=1 Tax=Natronomonas halophila TaxID=2747817 RepID=UPI0015B63174|nr:hypothetical protein [Natronomonas halophila]QLD84610.1 hypothetical protein HWV23_02420 [Natronomonas halophila]QLD84666.1 hypothetical protein HWV23_02705 [Natronomonas halophila]
MTDDSPTNDDPDELSRRRVLAGAAGIAAAGAAGFYAGAETVEAAPQGVFPVESDDPLEKLRADRIRLVPRTTDPSSPDAGELWYNSEA